MSTFGFDPIRGVVYRNGRCEADVQREKERRLALKAERADVEKRKAMRQRNIEKARIKRLENVSRWAQIVGLAGVKSEQ